MTRVEKLEALARAAMRLRKSIEEPGATPLKSLLVAVEAVAAFDAEIERLKNV